MKKSAIIFAAALVLVACNKPETTIPATDTNTLYARIEQETATRTYMDADNNILWSEGDQVVAFMKSPSGLQYQILPISVGNTFASFENITGSDANGTEWDHNVVYYPYSDAIEAEKTGSNYSLSVVLPAEQTYAEESFGNGAMAMVAVSEYNNITFRNVLGGMKLQLKGTQKVKSIRLEGKNNEKLSGAATVTAYTDETKPAITMAQSASISVILNCDSGVQLNESIATEFIIALPPVLFSKGFTVTVTDDDSQTYTVETDKANTVFRSSLLIMPVVDLVGDSSGNGSIEDDYTFKDYVDEYGLNHGKGTRIGETVWAPVNCGFHSTDYQYGKLYQWGRKFGHGYSGNFYGVSGSMTVYSDAAVPSVEAGGVSVNLGKDKSKSDIFYTGSYDWAAPPDPTLWNAGTEDNPVKTEYDPCPDGWRVPTCAEMSELAQHFSSSMTNDMGQKGCWLSGPVEYSESVPSVFFPMAGYLESDGDASQRGIRFKYWTSLAEGIQSYCFNWYLTLGKSVSSRAIGASVRCVQNDSESAVSESIMISHKYLKLVVGESEKLSVEVSSSSMEQPVPIWSSDDTSVIIVDADGVVTAVSEGTATITVVVGQMEARCEVAVIQMIDYIDEYDVNQGKGIKIGSTVWAPVNCGYHQTKYKYGRLFQWGRKYGQGYAGQIYVDGMVSDYYYDSTYPKLLSGAVTVELGNSEANSNVFYKASSDNVYDWANPYDDTLWNGGTEDNPVKTEYDPCPDGWRIPTYAELLDLTELCSWGQNSDGQTGGWFSRPVNGESDQSVLFLPAAGRYFVSGKCDERGLEGHYWSSRTSYRDACGLNFEKNSVYLRGIMPRATAMSVRCVQVTDEAAEL